MSFDPYEGRLWLYYSNIMYTIIGSLIIIKNDSINYIVLSFVFFLTVVFIHLRLITDQTCEPMHLLVTIDSIINHKTI